METLIPESNHATIEQSNSNKNIIFRYIVLSIFTFVILILLHLQMLDNNINVDQSTEVKRNLLMSRVGNEQLCIPVPDDQIKNPSIHSWDNCLPFNFCYLINSLVRNSWECVPKPNKVNKKGGQKCRKIKIGSEYHSNCPKGYGCEGTFNAAYYFKNGQSTQFYLGYCQKRNSFARAT